MHHDFVFQFSVFPLNVTRVQTHRQLNDSMFSLFTKMAFEVYAILAGSVSPLNGENIKPAYGGEKEAFLKKVVTPIYDTIAQVIWCKSGEFFSFLLQS